MFGTPYLLLKVRLIKENLEVSSWVNHNYARWNTKIFFVCAAHAKRPPNKSEQRCKT